MAEIAEQEVKVVLVIKGSEIERLEQYPGTGPEYPIPEELTRPQRRKLRRSAFGLRAVDAVYETQDTDEPVTRKCFMVIGGYKVEVPCPTP